MTVKYMAALAVSGILAVTLSASISVRTSHALELAGADEDDKATKDQLKRAGQDMVPAENLKKAKPRSEPTFKPASQPAPQPEKKAMPAKPAEQPKPMVKEMPKPAAEPKMEPKAMAPEIAGPYLRADVGYGISIDPDGTTSAGAMTGEDVSNLSVFGAGAGYRFDKNFRADVSIDYRPDTDVAATTAGGTNIASEVDGMTVMINGYYDIDGLADITPYVGVGFGYARLETADQTGVVTGGSTWNNLAWAAMLGAAVDVGLGEATWVDVGYRFISLGQFEQQDGTEYDDLYVHELRAGLRHMF